MASALCGWSLLAPYSPPLSWALLVSANLLPTERLVPPGPLHQLYLSLKSLLTFICILGLNNMSFSYSPYQPSKGILYPVHGGPLLCSLCFSTRGTGSGDLVDLHSVPSMRSCALRTTGHALIQSDGKEPGGSASWVGSTFGVPGPVRCIPNGLVRKGRRDSKVARGGAGKIENLRLGRLPRTGQERRLLRDSIYEPHLPKWTGTELAKVC